MRRLRTQTTETIGFVGVGGLAPPSASLHEKRSFEVVLVFVNFGRSKAEEFLPQGVYSKTRPRQKVH